MKYIFVEVYFLIETVHNPCPERQIGCLVNHGVRQDTSRIEILTLDSSRVNSIIKEFPDSRIDTFLVAPFHR